MWTKRAILSWVGVVLLLLPSVVAARSVSGPVTNAARWEGEIVLAGPVTVAPGATLTIAAGSRIRPANAEARISVQGAIEILGTASAPVVFEKLAGWQGIELIETQMKSRFDHVRFDGAQVAIGSIAASFTVRHASFVNCGTAIKLFRESNPLIEDSLFEGNGIGLDNEMKSAATVRRCRFVAQKDAAIQASHNSQGAVEENLFEKNRQGIVLQQKYADRIQGNRFVANEVAIVCNQTQSTPAISGNSFEKNTIAVVNFSFAYPVMENNRFVANGTAINNEQFGSPRIVHNLFRGNKSAIYNNRKSSPVVEYNNIEANERALFCDYSSYPRVKNNNFNDNRLAVELGIYQSADWEKRSGSRAIVKEQSTARRSQNPLLEKAPTQFDDFVEVSGNWWGRETALLAHGGNLAIFFDRKDKERVTYEGFGPDSYRLDEVRYTPWLTTPVKGAGPKAAP